ncbi:MAG TPA: ABC transporter substrate-binding protein [Clostridiales bacterium]|nr:ABC transporter substrate-binding protein [Clostridiales bacterium]
MKKFWSFLLVAVLCMSLLAGCGGGAAVDEEIDYPTATITAICPWSAGGGTDTFLRAICAATEPILGQTITVSNTTGGGGATGHGAIIAAEPDGYTIGMITFELNSLPPQGLVEFTYEDLDPLLRLNMDAAAITVPIDAPYDTLEAFLEYCKAHPGEVTVGNAGPGSVWHLAAGVAEQECGVTFNHIPYDGAAPAVTDLAGGHIDAVAVSSAEVLSQVKAGTMKILAVMAEERNPNFPEVPTFTEEGYNVVFGTWRGLAVPTGTPDEIKAILVEAFTEAYEDADFQELATSLGLGLAYQNTEDFKAFLAENAASVENTMKTLGLIE